MSKKWIYLFVLCISMCKNTPVSCIDLSSVDLVKIAKNSGKITKYATALISVLYIYKAVKGTVDAGKSMVSSIKKDFTLLDLIKLPFSILIKLPLCVFNLAKNYSFAFGFGATAYFLHRIGA